AFNNDAGGIFDAQNSVNTAIYWATNPQTSFNNAGIFRKTTTGAGRTIFSGSIFLNNSGTVDSQIGTIEIGPGTSTGTFTTSAGAAVEFTYGTHTLDAGATFTGSGSKLNGAVFNGTGFTVAAGCTLTWSAGTMNGAGQTTTVSPGGTVVIAGNVILDARTF